MTTPLQVVQTITAGQLALVTRAQMCDAGLTRHHIRYLSERGYLSRIRPCVYGLTGLPPSWERELLAVILAAGDDAVGSHSAAARLWSYLCRPEDRFEITVARLFRPELDGVIVHRSATLDETDKAQRNGVPCTTFERTLCDCTTLLSLGQLGRTLDDGLRRGVASLERLRRCAERLESGPGRHMSVIRSLLRDRGVEFNPGGSARELDLLRVIRSAGLPPPEQQVPVVVNGKKYRLDFAWRRGKVLMEYYGLPFHIGASRVVYDNDRITALAAAGWLPLVFTSESTERTIISRVTDALAQRGLLDEGAA